MSPTGEEPRQPRNPAWNSDELILALDAYVRFKGMPPAKTAPEIVALSEAIGRLTNILGETTHNETYRNVNGVYMKLMNFRRFDPAFIAQGRVGLSRGNQLEEVVWREFADDPERLARVAKTIGSAITTQDGVSAAEAELAVAEGEEEAVEGRIMTVLHRRRERSRQLIQKKKAAALKQHGRLCCEVCAFDFAVRYGERGAGFIECHHVRPVETLGDGTPTRLQDLALLCANCHRMIHACRPWLTPAELKAKLVA